MDKSLRKMRQRYLRLFFFGLLAMLIIFASIMIYKLGSRIKPVNPVTSSSQGKDIMTQLPPQPQPGTLLNPQPQEQN